MNSNLKKIIAVSSVILILGVAYYGNYLPLRKSQAFIHVTRNLGNAKSFEEFTGMMAVALDGPSPIGQEELVRNTASMLMNLVRGIGPNPQYHDAILGFVHKYYDPIMARGRGMSFEQNLYLLGLMHQISYVQTKNPEYLNLAKSYFEQGVALGPNRPQTLYGLFDLYRIEGNKEKAREIGARILSLWDDPTVRQTMDELGASASSTGR